MSPDPTEEPFALSGLAALVTTAARDSPDHVLVEDDDGGSTGAQLARRVRRLAALLRLGGLRRGERLLLVAGAQAPSIVALVATLEAGLEPVLAPCGLGPRDLAGYALAANATALIGPSRYGDWDAADVYLEAAAAAESIRGILTYGPDLVDGAADISFAALDAMTDRPAPDEGAPEASTIWTIAGPPDAPSRVAHRQAALFADALSLVEQARINPSMRLISLLPPSSMAGLVGGPFAAFVGASRLVLHGPFAAPRFLAHCDAEPGFHLVAPGAIGPIFEKEGLAAHMSSLILVSRYPDADAFVLPPTVACGRPVVDLYAFGEEGVLAQRRHNGEATPPMRVADLRVTGDHPMMEGLGARLNRARAAHEIHDGDRMLGSDIAR